MHSVVFDRVVQVKIFEEKGEVVNDKDAIVRDDGARWFCFAFVSPGKRKLASPRAVTETFLVAAFSFGRISMTEKEWESVLCGGEDEFRICEHEVNCSFRGGEGV